MSKIHYKILTDAAELHPDWEVLGERSIFFQKRYLQFLHSNTPQNMECFFVEIYQNNLLSGIALIQTIQLKKLDFLGNTSSNTKHYIKSFLTKKFIHTSLVVGNNMLSGQKAFYFHKNLPLELGVKYITLASKEIAKRSYLKGKKVKLQIFKDFHADDLQNIKDKLSDDCYCFSTQPNMVFYIKNNWTHFDDYINDLSKKYRDQYKRCRKKSIEVDKRKLTFDDLESLQSRMYELYLNVVNQSDFNTFFLPENHFSAMKRHLQDDFLIYGYFDNKKLIGFNTLIKNGSIMETYFLGYDLTLQKDKMLYLNMLYDMVAYSINNGFEQVNFGRTALEIKSSIGAEAVPLFGFMQHQSAIIQSLMPHFFNFYEPKVVWQKRNPFK